jgi:hypothetical protein
VILNRRGVDRASQRAGAEIERAALGDLGCAGGIDHTAVGDGERSDEAAAAADIAD